MPTTFFLLLCEVSKTLLRRLFYEDSSTKTLLRKQSSMLKRIITRTRPARSMRDNAACTHSDPLASIKPSVAE